jgi:predicted ATPase
VLLQEIRLPPAGDAFPFTLPLLRGTRRIVLDAPEAALSPLRSLAFVALVKDAVAHGGQFVVATHSPMLMAYPGARLYEIQGERMVATAYDDLDHVQTLRRFLDAPEAFFRHL